MPDCNADENSEITGAESVFQLIKEVSSQKFWGTLSFQFQGGKLTLIRKESTVKAGNIDLSAG